MAKKENKGGVLTNEQVEQELERSGQQGQERKGMQDTGDQIVRQVGTEVQQRDGLPDKGDRHDEH